MLAVFQNNSKQHLIKIDDLVVVDKINVLKGQLLVIKNLLMIYNKNSNIFIGKPFIKKAFVIAEVKRINIGRNNIILKKKRRKNYKKKTSFKKIFVILKIKSIIYGNKEGRG